MIGLSKYYVSCMEDLKNQKRAQIKREVVLFQMLAKYGFLAAKFLIFKTALCYIAWLVCNNKNLTKEILNLR